MSHACFKKRPLPASRLLVAELGTASPFILGVARLLPATRRRRREAPVDYECDFCKCWLPMYKCVYIFSYEHCSPTQPVLPPAFPRFSPMLPPLVLLNEKMAASVSRRVLQ